MSTAARMIDANANRAREALRVLEDCARFALNDGALCERFKSLRHGLQSVLATLPPGWIEANRDTAHDPGRDAVGAHEMQRANLHAVATAAGKRLGESFRVLEECMKVVHAPSAAALEQLRYASYEAEAALLTRLGSSARQQWRVCVLLTERLCARSWQATLDAALEGGADAIQVREKEFSDRDLAARVRAVQAQVRNRASIIVNDRADVALATGADGVHLGAEDLSIADIRKLAGTQLLVGVSTHSLDEAAAAVAAGADYCGVGAMFSTSTKPSITPQGEPYLRAFLAAHPTTPHLAIGGITPANARSLASAGARGVAVSSSVCSAADPAAAVRALREAFA